MDGHYVPHPSDAYSQNYYFGDTPSVYLPPHIAPNAWVSPSTPDHSHVLHRSASSGNLVHPSVPQQSPIPYNYPQFYGGITPQPQDHGSPAPPNSPYLQRSASTGHLPLPSTSQRSYLKPSKKLTAHMDLLNAHSWSLGEFLQSILSREPTGDKDVDIRRGLFASKFLSGQSRIGVGHILHVIANHPSRHPAHGVDEEDCNGDLQHEYQDMKSASSALSHFAVHYVHNIMEREIRTVIQTPNGLHISNRTSGSPKNGVFEDAIDAFRTHAPLTWKLLLQLATRPEQPKNQGAVVAVRKQVERPPHLTAVHMLSTLAYARNRDANLVPSSLGLLYFACTSNRYMYSLGSRLCLSTSYHGVYDGLIKMAASDRQKVWELGRSSTSALLIRADNVQTYVHPRDYRVGREAHMWTGTAATAFVVESFDADALSLQTKLASIAENKRSSLTIDDLWNSIDHGHIDTVCAIQWLEILVDFVPQLHTHKRAVANLYLTDIDPKFHRSPPNRKTEFYPLPTNGRNETILAELDKSITDILSHIGQTQADFKPRLVLFGGDGLTYERMVNLKHFKHGQPTSFESLEILEPFLELWHTGWTDLSRFGEAFWNSLMSEDPSSLGHNANVIKKKAPADLKKVDYYPFSRLAYEILSARILDCWRVNLCGARGHLLNYFASLKIDDPMLCFDSLKERAQTLYQTYGSIAAYHRALRAEDKVDGIPTGSPWKGQHSQAKAKSKATLGKGKKKSTEEALPDDFKGDQVLAKSSRFMFDAVISREVVLASAQGHPSRVWECLKLMIFSFAGSSHKKYMSYLLEQFCNLELESSEALRNLFMDNLLVNPSGIPGHYLPGDKLQEQLQDCLYEHIGPDHDFDDNYVRNVIAPNVWRFESVKKELNSALGLAKRSSRHAEPHHDPEIRKLMSIFEKHELHSFRPGRSYTAFVEPVDHLGQGYTLLAEGKLDSWVKDSLRFRQGGQAEKETEEVNENDEEGDDEDGNDDSAENGTNHVVSRGHVEMDGEGNLVIEEVEVEWEDEEESGDE